MTTPLQIRPQRADQPGLVELLAALHHGPASMLSACLAQTLHLPAHLPA